MKIPAKHGAYVRFQDDFYLTLWIDEKFLVVKDECKHKGGPLRLGTWNEKKCSMRCLWHNIVNTKDDLIARAVPSEVNGEWISFSPLGETNA